ncbi:MAG: acetate--CoA ligase [Rickettsiales bacterium]|nr:acetate--CoA ligase [Rickettsiales bacterium]
MLDYKITLLDYKITSRKKYQEFQNLAHQDLDQFWSQIAKNYHWFQDFDTVSNCDLKNAHINWFENGQTNISYNCLDRHLEERGDQVAIIYEPNDVNEEIIKYTYKELHQEVCKFANVLQANNVQKGDRVCIYMPMIIQGAIAMLACARIGAIHSVVFAGFSAKALQDRIIDCAAKVLITSDVLFRGGKTLKLFDIAAQALQENTPVKNVIVYQRLSSAPSTKNLPKTLIWQDEVKKQSSNHEAAQLDSEDTSFILYTSGSTGKPKGVIHSTAGYMTYAGYSFQNVFNYQKDDVFFCTADIGWITGHTYLVYGPLLNGATTIMFEGIPTYPDASRFWRIIEKHKVNIFYTAPTAIRALMKKGDEFVDAYKMPSLKVLGSVGEPINEEAWNWYNEKVGKNNCQIVDTWWQTETGGILISALPNLTNSKASFAGNPLPGIEPILLDNEGAEIKGADISGNLCIKKPWPSMIRGVWGDREKLIDTYLSKFPGYYFAGDSAFRSIEGLYRVIGRVDDVINVSGHRLGSAEIENAINKHEEICESAVIGFPHDIKGEAICVFAIAKKDLSAKIHQTRQEIIALVKKEIGGVAMPDKIFISSDLPKTRSGKIMRTILKKLINKENDLGDITTLVNPEIVEQLKEKINVS